MNCDVSRDIHKWGFSGGGGGVWIFIKMTDDETENENENEFGNSLLGY